jgi:hypothetical protein
MMLLVQAVHPSDSKVWIRRYNYNLNLILGLLPLTNRHSRSLALTLPSERDASPNQEPPTTTTDTLAAVPSTDDGGRPRTIALACRPPPHPTGRGSAVKKQSAAVGTKTVSTSTTKRKTNGARLASTLIPSTPEATSSCVQLLNSLGFNFEACYSFFIFVLTDISCICSYNMYCAC